MDEPRDFIGMTHEIRRKLGSDHQVDRFAVAFAQVDEPPRGRVRQDFLLRIPLERHADDLGLVAVGAQLLVQRADVVLGAAVHKWNLYFADNDALNGHSDAGGIIVSRE